MVMCDWDPKRLFKAPFPYCIHCYWIFESERKTKKHENIRYKKKIKKSDTYLIHSILFLEFLITLDIKLLIDTLVLKFFSSASEVK